MRNYQPLVEKLKEVKRLVKERPCETSFDSKIEGLVAEVENTLIGYMNDQDKEIEESAK